MATNINIVIIRGGQVFATTAAPAPNNLPFVNLGGGAVVVDNIATRQLIKAAMAAPAFTNPGIIDENKMRLLLNIEIIPGAAASHFAFYRVNNVESILSNAYSLQNGPFNATNPAGAAAINNIPLQQILDCLFDTGELPVTPDVVAPAPAAESPRRTRKEKYVLVDSWWPFGWPFGRYGPFRMPPLISQDSLRIPVKSAMPSMAPTVPRTGAPTAPSAPRAPNPNDAPKSAKAPRSPKEPGAKSSPRTRNSPRKQSPNGSTRGRSPRTGSPRGRSPRTGSPRGRSPGRMSPRMSPGRMSRGRRGGFYEKYLKYKTKYLALKKELGL